MGTPDKRATADLVRAERGEAKPMIEIYSLIRTLVDVPAFDLKAGALGVVIEIYGEPHPGYEIEFLGEADDDDPLGNLGMELDEVEAVSGQAADATPKD